ncbi:WYL domain-containing protein [Micromonospora terminaliae]|uniref:WYL domain-containing protein n=1 Tax=Micromonospora terminaliae TaxID=1914461 RepID=A0AAJ2ZD37_9ACTN|nr:YafY family protein [Micromonospora terminaliae]NES27787.1 YafY family transcriptional regulator [Micromonospora terminaliae]QGL47430.1 WYL domain-containing protein [Micromonospora terminaliae]
MSDPRARLLSLLSLLQTPRLWPGSELAQRLGVSGRTLRRDIDRLRDLGYPVHAEQGGLGGYRLAAGAAMPPLLLEDDEAVAVAIGLRTAAAQPVAGVDEAAVRALGKLLQVLPARLRRRVDTLASSTVAHPFAPAVEPVDPDTLVVASAAIANHERLRFRYRDQGRHVEPRALVTAGRRWYLLAFDLDRDDWRTFRLDTVTTAAATGARATTRDVPGGDVAAFVADRTMRMAPTCAADVVLHAPAAQVVDRLGGPPPGTLTDRPDGTCRWLAPPDTPEWHALRLASIGLPFTVDGPPELAAHLRSTAALFRAATAGPARPVA